MKPQLRWIVARLGQDQNWWVDETSEDVYWGSDSLSLLDPGQLAQVRESLAKLQPYGFDPSILDRAFHLFEVSSQLPDGRLKLIRSSRRIDDADARLFALPDVLCEAEGAYPDLLDQVSALQIKMLNATHDYVQEVTVDEMDEEIQTRNADRYFAATAVHVFNELEDILTWKPAEWDEADEPSSGPEEEENEDDEEDEDEDKGEEDDDEDEDDEGDWWKKG